ncbi:Hypothetical protein A7982_05993 [Minicystis rosea]|nr:Hypothetical protein A7982_05993 [Minicystis rosea]
MASNATGSGGAGGQGTSTSTASGNSGGASTTGSGGATTSTGTGTASSAPVILTLGTNVTSITQGESLTVSAIVTDPDGIDDVIGGNLSDENNSVYGAFATTGQEGAYQMIVSWAQFQQVQKIEFAQGESSQRTLVATFFDQGGHSVQKSVDVTLACKGNGACDGVCKDMSADAKNCGTCANACAVGATCAQSTCSCQTGWGVCNGVCRDLQLDEANCGTCGHVCPTGTSCFKGTCGTLTACSTNKTSCLTVCQGLGKTCYDGCQGLNGASNVGAIVYQTAACGAPLGAGNATCGATIGAAYGEKCCCY